MKLPNTWDQLKKDMEACEQTSGVNMIQHGEMVWNQYAMLQEILDWGYEKAEKTKFLPEYQEIIDNFRLPTWFFKYEDGLAWNREDRTMIRLYTLYHDCGKPYCKTVDENGRSHFPNHAEVSYRVWNHINNAELRKYHGRNAINKIGELIRRDMEIHTIKSSDIPEFCRDKETAVTLLLVGLAEIHANAAMFGGFDSKSFKIKYKQIERRGKAICKFLELDKEFEETEE